MKHFSEISPSAERVVDAAEMLIQLHGYNGFSYDDISRQIGIKKPSIHHHFATKADLVRVVVQRYSYRFLNSLNAIEANHKDAAKRLSAYADLFAQTYKQDRRLCVCGILGAEAVSLSTEVAHEVLEFFQMNLNWLTKIFKEGAIKGTLRFASTPKSQAYAFLSALEGAMIVGRGLGNDSSPAVVGRTFISNLLA